MLLFTYDPATGKPKLVDFTSGGAEQPLSVAGRNQIMHTIFDENAFGVTLHTSQWFDHGVIVGVFVDGEIVHGQTSGAYAIRQTQAGSKTLLARLSEAGFTSGETIIGVESGATTTITPGTNGTVTIASTHKVVVTSGTATDGPALAFGSVPTPGIPGALHYHYKSVRWVDGGVAGINQYSGMFNRSAAVFVGFEGTDFVFGYRSAGVDTTFASATWIDPLDGSGASGFNLNTTKFNEYLIEYGVAQEGARLFVRDDSGVWILAAAFRFQNTRTDPVWVHPSLRPALVTEKTSPVVTDVTIECESWNTGWVGFRFSIIYSRRYATTAEATIAAITETPVLTLKSRLEFGGDVVLVPFLVSGISVDTDGNKPVRIRLRKDALLDTATYVATEGAVDVDTTATTATGGKVEWLLPLGERDAQHFDLEHLGIVINPGETLTISAESKLTAVVGVTVNRRDMI